MVDTTEKKKLNIEDALEKEVDDKEDASSLGDYNVKLESFEGPFDLLLHMIDEGKVEIHTISITQIIVGYMEYLKQMKDLNIVIASEFLLMAAYLIEMKSKMLLPVQEVPEEEENLEEIEKTLLDRIHEYKVFKELASRLQKRKEVFGRVYTRHSIEEAPMEEDREVFLTDVTLRDLVSAFQKVWKEIDSKGKTHEIQSEYITLPDKIKEVTAKLKKNKDGIPFIELFTKMIKLEVVVTFLAILELARQRKLVIKQGGVFGSIIIVGREL